MVGQKRSLIIASMDRETVIKTLTSLVPNFVESYISDDSNLIEQGIIDSNQFIELITQLEDCSGKEIDFLTVNPETISSVDGLTKTFNEL